jgi:predicted transcriptional regulator
MEALLNIAKSFKILDINKVINDTVKNHGIDDLIIELNTQEQLFKKGINTDKAVVGFYSTTTESINPLKKAGTHFTFKDTGKFFDSWIIRYESDAIIIEANGQKQDTNLFEKYGQNLLGLTDENLQKVIDEIKKFLPEEILKEAFRIASTL